MSRGTIYICHHIDTEGPLWEEITELFKRLKLIFNIDLKPTKENLKKLQNKEFNFEDNMSEQIERAVNPHTIDFKTNWKDIEDMLHNIMSKKYRNKMLDSDNNGWVYNWNIMDHVGFKDNPRHRDMGYFNIYNFYEYMIDLTNSTNDKIHWHFHPIPFYKQANIPATSYDNSIYEIHQVITRRLIEKLWFPRVNRAGFHTERIDSNFFLEQWIPFDPSNQAVEEDNELKHQKDLSSGRYGDWRGAPTDWSIYNPSIYDWRQKGDCNRVIARILNMKSRHRNITFSEIEKAFVKAENGDDVYLGITNHDWREMSTEIDEFRDILKQVILKYPHIKYKFSESVNAFRKVLGFDNKKILNNKITFDANIDNSLLTVNITNGDIFGPQPYLALKTNTGDYFHDNFDFQIFKKSFSYTFDTYTLPLSSLSNIAIASNDKYGNTFIIKFTLENGNIVHKEKEEILC